MTDQLSMFEPQIDAPVLTDYDWIVINSSAGKDSMAMLDYVCELAQTAGMLDRVIVVHADLGRVEWPGTKELAEQQTARYDVPFVVVRRGQGDMLEEVEDRSKWPSPSVRFCTAHHKQNQVDKLYPVLTGDVKNTDPNDLLSHIERHGKFPDSARRYCTSDHKRAPVDRLFTALATTSRERTKKTRPRILNCMGMRAEESPARAKKRPFDRGDVLRLNTKKQLVYGRGTNTMRIVDQWLPIHSWKVLEVWERIAKSRINDLVHHAYGLGMRRLSCIFCIFADKASLVRAGRHNRDLLLEYVRVEEKIGHKFKAELSLKEILEIVDSGEDVGEPTDFEMA